MSFLKVTPDINSFNELNDYLVDLEDRVFNAFKTGDFSTINLQKLSVAPGKNNDGDVLYADGDSFDPGSGVGVYYHNGTGFIKIG